MILYSRIHIIFWMTTESSPYVLINIFSNNLTSVPECMVVTCLLKLPHWGPVQYRTAVAIMQWGVDLLVNGFKQSSPSCKREKQPKCKWRVHWRLKTKHSSPAFSSSEGSNVNPLSMFLSFHLTQPSIHCGGNFFSLYFLYFSLLLWFLTCHGCHCSYVGVCILSVRIMSLICGTQVLLIWYCSVLRQRPPDENWTLLLLGLWLTTLLRDRRWY